MKVSNLLKIGAPEAHLVLGQLLKFSYTLFGTVPGSLGDTGGKGQPPAAGRHPVVIGHIKPDFQSAPNYVKIGTV